MLVVMLLFLLLCVCCVDSVIVNVVGLLVCEVTLTPPFRRLVLALECAWRLRPQHRKVKEFPLKGGWEGLMTRRESLL